MRTKQLIKKRKFRSKGAKTKNKYAAKTQTKQNEPLETHEHYNLDHKHTEVYSVWQHNDPTSERLCQNFETLRCPP